MSHPLSEALDLLWGYLADDESGFNNRCPMRVQGTTYYPLGLVREVSRELDRLYEIGEGSEHDE